MSAAEDEEPAHGSASLRQHKTAGRAKQRQQLPAHEQTAIRAANTTARANKRERKRNTRDEDEAAAASLQHSAAKQQRSGSLAKVCFADRFYIHSVFSGFNEAFAVEVNIPVWQELPDDEYKRKREEAAEAALLHQRSPSAQRRSREEAPAPAPFVVQVRCAEDATFLFLFFLVSMKWFVDVPLPGGTLPCRWRCRGVGHDRGLWKGSA